jgi:hypothetical protein
MQTALGTCRRRGAAPPGAARHTHDIHLALIKRMPARTHGGRFAEGGRHTSARMHGRASPAAMCAGRSSRSAITPAARSGACRNCRVSGACRTTGACRSRVTRWAEAAHQLRGASHTGERGRSARPPSLCRKIHLSVAYIASTHACARTCTHSHMLTEKQTHVRIPTPTSTPTPTPSPTPTRARACTRTHAHRYLRRTRHRRDEREVAQRPAGEHSAQPDVVFPRATASPCHRNWLGRRRRASPAYSPANMRCDGARKTVL